MNTQESWEDRGFRSQVECREGWKGESGMRESKKEKAGEVDGGGDPDTVLASPPPA